MIKYSFVLPAYKAYFFKEALDSILNQTYKNFEVVIVNDASPENLDAIVKKYNDSRVRYYVNEENIGGKDLVAQWNHCLEFVNGEYIILASDDDVYSPLYLEKMNKLVCKYPEVNVLRPRVMFIDEKGSLFSYSSTEGYLKEKTSPLEFIHAWVYDRIGSGIPFYMFKREALLQIGGFVNLPLAWFSDDATVFKLLDNGLAYTSEVLFYFRMSGENITTKLNTKESLLKKLSATNSIYDLLNIHIASIKSTTIEENILLVEIKKMMPIFLFNNKIVNQLFCAPFYVIMSVFPAIMRMDFVPKIKLMERYLKYLIGKMKFCK